MDIEDVSKLLAKEKVCPYYSTRNNSNYAQILCVPYNSIINKNMRQSLGIDLKNSILIFDEAHNLVDNVIQTYNHKITYKELYESSLKIKEYYNKYKSRLKNKNVYKLDQINQLFNNFMSFIKSHKNQHQQQTKSAGDKKDDSYVCYRLQEVIVKLNMIDFNLFELKEFIDVNQLSRKLNYFCARKEQQLDNNNNEKDQVKIHKMGCGSLAEQKKDNSEKTDNSQSTTLTSIEKFFNLCSDLLGASTTESKIVIKIDQEKMMNSE